MLLRHSRRHLGRYPPRRFTGVLDQSPIHKLQLFRYKLSVWNFRSASQDLSGSRACELKHDGFSEMLNSLGPSRCRQRICAAISSVDSWHKSCSNSFLHMKNRGDSRRVATSPRDGLTELDGEKRTGRWK